MLTNKPTRIITHHSNGTLYNPCAETQHHSIDIIDDHHRTRWPGFTSKEFRRENGKLYHCGYHFVIWKNKGQWTYTQTRAVWEEGAHCIGLNTSSIGVCIVGNYDACSGEEIPDEAIEVWKKVYNEIQKQVQNEFGYTIDINKVEPHRKYASKSCHGDTLADDFFKRQIMFEKSVSELVEMQKQLNALQKIVEKLQRLIILIMNRSTSKRLSLREGKNYV